MEPGVSPRLWPPKLYGDINQYLDLESPRFPETVPDIYLGNRTVDAFVYVSPQSGGVWSSPRPISTGQLHTLRCFHIRPINPIVYWGPYPVAW